ncbi:acetylxylan esterase [Paenibacillaceae bacterium WGS1546]|uniref:acetylxylan esterase n=1 Tax=Cohnella sp. WGS1546 TaxID=3366810 RepID=UPI00372CFD2E
MSGTKFTGPWEVERLTETPNFRIERTEERETFDTFHVYYESVPYRGKPTRVFAHYALPNKDRRPLPAIVLVHGGAGRAFPEWTEQWAARGYAAFAMDLFGNGPDGERLEDGGPDQTDKSLFLDISSDSSTNMWLYHAVAAVIRGVSIVAEQPEVEAGSIGLMGISWGGYTVQIVRGLDDRIAYAMAVYASGFLAESSSWQSQLFQLSESRRRLWHESFDSSRYIQQSTKPIFLATGANDPCFYLNSWQRTARLAGGHAMLRVAKEWEHNYQVPWGTKEFFVYADSQTKEGSALPQILDVRSEEGEARVRLRYRCAYPIRHANLVYSVEESAGDPDRKWLSAEVQVAAHGDAETIECAIPADAKAFFLTLENVKGHMTSTNVMDR